MSVVYGHWSWAKLDMDHEENCESQEIGWYNSAIMELNAYKLQVLNEANVQEIDW